MLGAFQYYFFSKGLGWKSVLVIWIHGTLEISSIIIAGAAGIVSGERFPVSPEHYKRIPSLKRAAKDGVKMMIGLVPVFVMAAFLEGFVTRYSKMPVWLSLFILILSAEFYYLVFHHLSDSFKRKRKDGSICKTLTIFPCLNFLAVLFLFFFCTPPESGPVPQDQTPPSQDTITISPAGQPDRGK